MSYLVLILYFIVVSFLLVYCRWVRQSGIKSWVLVLLLAIKLLGGIAITYLYGFHYGDSTDIYIYYNDAQYLNHVFTSDYMNFLDVFLERNADDPEVYKHFDGLRYWSSGTHDFIINERKPLIILNFLISFISFGNIYIHVFWMSLVAFLGQIALFRFFKSQKIISDVFTLVIVFLLPTFLLWTSTVLKEPLILFSLGFGLYFMGEYLENKFIKYLILSLLFLSIGLFCKAFVTITLLFPLMIFVLFKKLLKMRYKVQVFIVLFFVVFFNVLFYLLSLSSFNVYQKLSDKQTAFYEIIKIQEQSAKVGSLMEIPILEPTFLSYLENIFPAFTRVLFKPSLYELSNVLYLPDIFQNFLVLILALLIPFKLKDIKKEVVPFLWLSILFIFINYSVIGLVVPVLGAVVRYKIIALPFLFMFLMAFLNLKLPKKFSRIFLYDN